MAAEKSARTQRNSRMIGLPYPRALGDAGNMRRRYHPRRVAAILDGRSSIGLALLFTNGVSGGG
jgi:hypothetical protein